ncbi:MAG: inosine/xanthosine triphosphatase [Candidatus Altarchaeaceae archaeon]
MKILVGSENRAKINAVKYGFLKYKDFFNINENNIEVIGIKVNSDVNPQPINDEVFKGAENRALEVKRINDEKNLNADFFVGIEGGTIRIYDKFFNFGCVCIIDKNGDFSYGTSPMFPIPENIANKIFNERKELCYLIKDISNKEIKEIKENIGAIGFFSKGVMNITELYTQGVIVALIKFISKDKFKNE